MSYLNYPYRDWLADCARSSRAAADQTTNLSIVPFLRGMAEGYESALRRFDLDAEHTAAETATSGANISRTRG